MKKSVLCKIEFFFLQISHSRLPTIVGFQEREEKEGKEGGNNDFTPNHFFSVYLS